jgi:undecaprenyl diphosphate synthase
MKAVSLKEQGATPPPAHVAIIMDGNGRWAQSRGLPRIAGHKKGAESVKRSVESAVSQGISFLTLFGFSSENWKRPLAEVTDLMGLLRLYLKTEIATLNKQGVRFLVIGDRSRLSDDIIELIEVAEQKTVGNARLTLTVALSYGGRAEIVSAAHKIAEDAIAGNIQPSDIDEDLFSGKLFTTEIPDPDLLIRTSGEQRISNFLLWQLAYTELVFIDTLWPDFSEEHFETAVKEYQGRERRFGTTGA